MSFTPAISDADLARLLGAASTTPPLPAGLCDRIMAALPADPVPLPPPTALRPARRRWLRPAIAIAASLAIGSAVAAGLVDVPRLAPILAPLLQQLGVAPAPARRPQPTARTAARPHPAQPAPAAAPPALATPALPPPRLQAELPAPAAPATLPTFAPPAPLASRPPAAPARPAPTAIRAAIRAEHLPDLPARPVLIAPPPVAIPPLPDAVTTAPPAVTAAPDAATDAAESATRSGPAATLPATAAERAAALQALRQARQNGSLTPDQARQLRALQTLRAARANRPPPATRPR